jgi:hypothetical protein
MHHELINRVRELTHVLSRQLLDQPGLDVAGSAA